VGSDAGISRRPSSGTLAGFGAIVLWSTTVALARSLSERLGPITAACAVYSVGGAVALVRLGWNAERRRSIARLARRYLFGCGALFVAYMTVLFLSVGLADSRRQVLEVGLLNYLWPALTILFSLVLLNKRATWVLVPGTALALAGEVLVLTQGADVSVRSFTRNLSGNPAAYGLGLAAALCWGLYSTLTRRWAGGRRRGGVDLFLPATALALLFMSLFVDEPRAWSMRSLAEAGFLGTATYLAYGLWDRAMRTGNVVVVAAGSYLTPLFSTVVSCVYLAVAPEPSLWLGCAMLVAGSLASWWSVSERPGGQ